MNFDGKLSLLVGLDFVERIPDDDLPGVVYGYIKKYPENEAILRRAIKAVARIGAAISPEKPTR